MIKNTYYSALTHANNNPKSIFNTLAKLTRNHDCAEPCILIDLSCDNIFFSCMRKEIL